MTRARARRAYRRSSDKRRRYQDYFCLAKGDVRAGYASSRRLVRRMSKRQRRQLKGHVVWISTANHHFALHGVRPGTRLTRRVRRRLHVSRAFRVGRNFWYFTPAGRASGLIRVQRGRIREVGIATKALVRTRKQRANFLRSFS